MDDQNKKNRQYELIQQLSEIVTELEWVIGLPAGEDMVPGLIIGTEDFVKEVVTSYYGPNFTTFSEDPTGESNLIEKDQTDLKKKGPTYH